VILFVLSHGLSDRRSNWRRRLTGLTDGRRMHYASCSVRSNLARIVGEIPPGFRGRGLFMETFDKPVPRHARALDDSDDGELVTCYDGDEKRSC
jgi:hypothetical protein